MVSTSPVSAIAGSATAWTAYRGTEPIRGGVATNRIMSTTQNAIEEVKMVTTVLPAENGHSAGGMLSVTYKSGTNQLHFEAEDRYINNPLLHRAYFNLERPTAPFSYHELAALVSGPVYIPKLYDGRNKTFFLFGWSRHHEKYNQQVFADVPTPDMLNGDFSFGGLGYPDLRSCFNGAGCRRQLDADAVSRQYHSRRADSIPSRSSSSATPLGTPPIISAARRS